MQTANSKENTPLKRKRSFDFFYYEQVGSRYYLRFTRLTLFLFAGLTVVSIVMLVALFFLSNRLNPPPPTNVNITVPNSSVPSSNQSTLQPMPALHKKWKTDEDVE